MDSVSLQHWLMQFGVDITGLSQIVGEFGDWIPIDLPTWAAYRALMSRRLIGLKKCPGVRPVGMGDTWHRILAKCLLAVTGAEAKEVYGTEQLYGRLEAGIEGGIHAVQLLW